MVIKSYEGLFLVFYSQKSFVSNDLRDVELSELHKAGKKTDHDNHCKIVSGALFKINEADIDLSCLHYPRSDFVFCWLVIQWGNISFQQLCVPVQWTIISPFNILLMFDLSVHWSLNVE